MWLSARPHERKLQGTRNNALQVKRNNFMLFNVRPTNLDENVFDIKTTLKRYRKNEQESGDENDL